MNAPARFEHLLADLSARFAGVPFEKVDTEIDRSLELLVEYLGTDRSTFLGRCPRNAPQHAVLATQKTRRRAPRRLPADLIGASEIARRR